MSLIADLYGDKIKTEFIGAGVIPYCEKTKRYLFTKRSSKVKHSGTWAGFGGQVDSGESLENAAIRELYEEAGYSSPIKLKMIFKYDEPKFKYFNFIGIIEEEFEPKLNWENSESKWIKGSAIKRLKLHPGIIEMLKNVDLK